MLQTSALLADSLADRLREGAGDERPEQRGRSPADVHEPECGATSDAGAESAFRREGKIRVIGLSNFSPEQMGRFQMGTPHYDPASLQSIRARDRKGRAALRREARACSARLWRALPWTAEREDHRQDRVQR